MAEFDHLASSYEKLLDDPIRNRFAGGSKFFHERKLELLLDFLGARNRPAESLEWIDVGCGLGDFLRLGGKRFAGARGCDVSAEMLKNCGDLDVRLQDDENVLPFPSGSADLVTAVCVYHHVPVAGRAALTAEAFRLLRPGGIFAVIEHNPWNPATRLIVSRTPVDADAILLRMGETVSLMRAAGLGIAARTFFLYLPEKLYRKARWVESLGARVPLGGQYAVFGSK